MRKTAPDTTPLSEENARFLATAESLTIASRDLRRVPSVIKATGCRVDADRRRVTVFVHSAQSRQLLADIEATAAVAVVFSRPTTHHTLQVKGSDARVGPLGEGDAAIIAAQKQAFAHALVPMGYRRDWALAVFGMPLEGMVAVTFTVDAVFMQTPGPGAGARLGSAP